MHQLSRLLLSGLVTLSLTFAATAAHASWSVSISDVMNLVYCLVGAGDCDGLAPASTVDITTDNQAAFQEGVASVDITSDNGSVCEAGGGAWADGTGCTEPITLSQCLWMGTCGAQGLGIGALAEYTEDDAAAVSDECLSMQIVGALYQYDEPQTLTLTPQILAGKVATCEAFEPLGPSVVDPNDCPRICDPGCAFEAGEVWNGGGCIIDPVDCPQIVDPNDCPQVIELGCDFEAGELWNGGGCVASVDITSDNAAVIAAATQGMFTQVELAAAVAAATPEAAPNCFLMGMCGQDGAAAYGIAPSGPYSGMNELDAVVEGAWCQASFQAGVDWGAEVVMGVILCADDGEEFIECM